ncbi:MAG TPA: helix-turn-helix domain-containing protein [candidate division Zixibacteria bacterium]|nr:helix-turn-helix domain-containing protein [candidate division Zixibacteria bacterium]
MAAKSNNEDRVIEYLADSCSREILALTSKRECSALELSDELNVPLSTVYRKLKLLERSELIQHVKTVMNLTGNEEKYYRCVVREAIVSFKDGELSISLKKEDYSDKFIRLWKRLSH